MSTTNHQVRLAARPEGTPKRSDWNFTEETLAEPRLPAEVRVVIDHVAGSRRGQRQEFASGRRVRFGRHPELATDHPGA